jgi:hypothetical protein
VKDHVMVKLEQDLAPTDRYNSAELARRDSSVFEEMKCLFSFTPMSSFGGDVTWCFIS